MENEMPAEETQRPGSAKPAMPKGASFLSSATPEASAPGLAGGPDATRRDVALTSPSEERTGVFRQLVTDDGDIAGLVAYSIYKQNKLDWLNAFTAQKGRAPKDDELSSYIIGEATPRRLATYRHLAEATLVGNGPEIGGPLQGMRTPTRRFGDKAGLNPSTLAIYALIGVLFFAGFLLAAHYTMSSR